MKKDKFFVLAMLALALAFGLLLAACDSGIKYDNEFDVATIAEFDAAIAEARRAPGDYLIRVNGNLLDYAGVRLETAGVNVTVRGTGTNRIKNADAHFIFLIGTGAKLTLENITLDNNASGGPAVSMTGTSAAFIMNSGVIENCSSAVNCHDGVNASITINGGTLRNTEWESIRVGEESSTVAVTINGGTLKRIGVFGAGTSVTVAGGTISNNDGVAISTHDSSTNAVITIKGGDLSGSLSGIFIEGSNHTVAISGGKLHGVEYYGVTVGRGAGHTVTKTGGTVTGGIAAYFVSASAQATVTGF